MVTRHLHFGLGHRRTVTHHLQRQARRLRRDALMEKSRLARLTAVYQLRQRTVDERVRILATVLRSVTHAERQLSTL